jgi:hypothetical protein
LLVIDLFGIRLICHRAVRIADSAAGAEIWINVSRSLFDLHFETAALPFDLCQVRVGNHLYVQVPADLDQFGGDDSHGAVIGREGLVELSHNPADGGGFLHQVNVVSGICQIESGLHSGYTTAQYHHCARLVICHLLLSFTALHYKYIELIGFHAFTASCIFSDTAK